jgi:hypothetical protein
MDAAGMSIGDIGDGPQMVCDVVSNARALMQAGEADRVDLASILTVRAPPCAIRRNSR